MITVHVVQGVNGLHRPCIMNALALRGKSHGLCLVREHAHDPHRIAGVLAALAIDPECVWGWGGTKYSVAEVPSGWPMVERAT